MNKNKIKNSRRSFLLGLSSFGSASLLHQNQFSSAQAEDLGQYIEGVIQESKRGRGKTLRQIAASKGIVYGGFTQRAHDDLPQDLFFQKTFAREYALVVGGFFGVTVGPFDSNSTYNFIQTDAFFNFATQNNLIFRAHPLIWNEFNSPWLVAKFKASDTTSAEIDKIFINHISRLVKRHAGKVHSWDVVNEAINVDDGRSDNLKDTTKSGVRGEKYNFPTWLNYLGSNYIERAFRIAAQVDPKAILTYNDNGLTYSNPFGNSWDEQRRAAILKLLERLKAKGTPIHALGIQSHLEGHRNKEFDESKFRKFLSDVASLGLKIIISELDVRDDQLPQDIITRDRIVADTYYQYLSVALDEPAVTTVVNWGLSDRYTWLSDFAPRADGAKVRPLLLDENFRRKPAWKAVARALNEAPVRHG
jgi:endo-1,4-beta-xylanase